MTFFQRSGGSPPRKPVVKRAFTGLAGSPLSSVAVEDPPPSIPDIPAKKRGRPFANGERRKTAAEIKRDQRRREKEEVEAINREREEHIAKEDALRAAARDLRRRLSIAELNDDKEEAYDLYEQLNGLLCQQPTYEIEIQKEQEREAKNANKTRVAVVDNEKLKKLGLNGKFAAKGLPSLNAGLFLNDAEQGKGELIYGLGQNLNSGRLQIDGKNIPRSRAEGRRVVARGTDPHVYEKKKMRDQKDVVPHVNLSKWIHAKGPQRRKKDEAVAPVAHDATPCCFVPGCGESTVGIHPEDVRQTISDRPRYVCERHMPETVVVIEHEASNDGSCTAVHPSDGRCVLDSFHVQLGAAHVFRTEDRSEDGRIIYKLTSVELNGHVS